MKNVLFICILLFASPVISMGANDHTIEVEFSFNPQNTPEKLLIGYRLYKQGEQVCDTGIPQNNSISCNFSSEDGTFDFALTARYSDNTESSPSPLFPFTISSVAETDPAVPLLAVISPTPSSGEIPLSISFDGKSSTGNIASYSWDFGDGYGSSGSLTSHTYTNPGTYTAILEVVDPTGTSYQATTTITALPQPTSAEPPTAIISSSTAAGNAPLNVSFNGTASTTTGAPITSFHWTFGDGSTATGRTADHTFQKSGTYYTELTIEDSEGLTDTVSTPIVVIGVAPANEMPVAIMTADTFSEDEPLTFSFDAAQSHDPDGTIKEYTWNFGDGTTGNGRQTSHIYNSAATYTATLQVTDDRGDTSTTQMDIVCSLPLSDDIHIEVGEVTVNHQWITIDFADRFSEPVVVAGPPTNIGGDPVLVKIRNVNEKSFQVRLQEWDYLDGHHKPETFSYIVIEKGTYTLDNGIKIEAGNFNGSSSFETITLENIYDFTPIIMTQVLTENETDAVTGRSRNVNQYSFEYKLQEMELTAKEHTTETVGYIAWEPGRGEIIEGLMYETGITTEGYTHKWSPLTFETNFPDQPFLLAGMQTCSGGNTSAVRRQGLTQTGSLIKIEEEQSKDAEVKHNKDEIIGYFSLSVTAPETE